MRKIMCLFISFVLAISMCFGSVFAEEIVFDVSEEAKETEETVFEEPANWDEEENVTEDSFVIKEELVSEDSSLAEDELILLEDVHSEEVVSSEDAAYVDEDLVSDDYAISEDEVISGETITDDPSFENAVASGTCGDNLIWQLTGEEGNMTLTISGSGSMYDYDNKNNLSPWFSKRESITDIVISEGVTRLGDWTFLGCYNLKSATIPNSVISIGRDAFAECEALINITIPNSITKIGEYSFCNCSSLTSISLSDNIKSIGEGAFSGCTSLTNVSIPYSITVIEDYVFSDCESLTSITIPDGVKSIGFGAFEHCSSLVRINIPKSVVQIESAFFYCTDLLSFDVDKDNPVFTSFDGILFNTVDSEIISCVGTKTGDCIMPSNAKSIAKYAFYGCKKLTSIIIPKGVTNIQLATFGLCTNVKSITIPDSVISIGNDAFANCYSLESIVIPNSVKNIGDFAFTLCTSMSSIVILNSVTSIGEYAFDRCDDLTMFGYSGSYAEKYADANNIPFKILDTSFENIVDLGTCGDNLTWELSRQKGDLILTISGKGEMYDYDEFPWDEYLSSIIKVIIKEGVTNIEFGAFYSCMSLSSITIPGSVTSIGGYAFEDCSSLTSITIPNNVTNIGESAFVGCDNLTIYGYSGSYAEKYAIENNIPFVSLSTNKVSKITLDKASYNIFAGNTATIKATISPSDAKDKTLNYKSDNTSIAKVSKSGKITAVAVGTATITVSANDGSGVKASCIVNVYNKPTAGLNITKKTLYTKGEPHQFILTPTVNNGELVSVTYSSSAPKKAYVAKSGKVTGKGAGTATITATVKMKNECGSLTKKLTCKVTVKKPTLTVSPTSVSLKKGKAKKLAVKVTPKGTVTYTSSDKKIATVSKAGKITAKKKGSCQITVECYGIKKTVKVTVKE